MLSGFPILRRNAHNCPSQPVLEAKLFWLPGQRYELEAEKAFVQRMASESVCDPFMAGLKGVTMCDMV